MSLNQSTSKVESTSHGNKMTSYAGESIVMRMSCQLEFSSEMPVYCRKLYLYVHTAVRSTELTTSIATCHRSIFSNTHDEHVSEAYCFNHTELASFLST